MKIKNQTNTTESQSWHYLYRYQNYIRESSFTQTFFFVNGIPLFLSKTGKLNVLSGANLKKRNGREITKTIDRYKKKHEQRGFEITDIHGNNNFNIQSLQDFLQPTNIHIHMLKMNMLDSFIMQ